MNFIKRVSVLFCFSLFLFVLKVFSADNIVTPVRVGTFSLQSSSGNFSGFLGAYSGLESNKGLIGNNAISNFFYSQNEDTGNKVFTISPMISDQAYVNFYRADPKDNKHSISPTKSDLSSNPVYDKAIAYLTLMSGSPVVVLSKDTVAPVLGDLKKVCLVEEGGFVRTNIESLNDSQSNQCSKISAIAASRSIIFAAVAPQSSAFGSVGSAISLLYKDVDYLHLPNVITGAKFGNIPADIDLNALGIGQKVVLDDVVSMYWDESIGKLFVALSSKGSAASVGGAISILVGTLDSSNSSNPYKFSLTPIVKADSSYFVQDGNHEIIGFYNSDATSMKTAIYKMKTLTTSTNKKYLIVNGGVSASAGFVKNKVFALPIVSGMLASKNDFTKQVSQASEMTLDTDLAAIIGGGVLPSDNTTDIQDLFVVGDSVFVCLSDNSVSLTKQGIFSSSAVFDKTGKIASWTPWLRIMGSTNTALGGAVDVTTGNVLYLSVDAVPATYLNVTKWGVDSKDGLLGGGTSDDSVGLVSVLASEFDQESGGVQQIFSFDENVPTFKASTTVGALSMIVACGYSKVVLIETGREEVVSTFLPNSGDFKTNILRSTDGRAVDGNVNSRVMSISGGVLGNMGPISRVEISRCAKSLVDKKGWIFVSGYNGVAVLSEPTGEGWTTAAAGGLQYGFQGLTSTMSFKKLGNFSKVRTVVCDDTNLYILTADSLYVMALDSANFSTAGALAPTFTQITSASTLTGNVTATFNDLIVSSKVAVLATSEGLFRSGDGKNIKTATDWDLTEIKLSYDSVDFSFKQSKQLFPLSIKKGGFEQGGNFYLLNSDYCLNLADIYRFYIKDTSGAASVVDSDTVQRVVEAGTILPFFSLGTYRANIFTDGALFYTELSQNFGNRNFVKVSENKLNMTNYASRGTNIDLGVNSTNYSVGLMLRNSASGALIVPGDFGIRVNE